jgi:hypothetical protein
VVGSARSTLHSSGRRRLLALVGTTADIIGFTALGRTLDDGHRYMVDWSERFIEGRVAVAN